MSVCSLVVRFSADEVAAVSLTFNHTGTSVILCGSVAKTETEKEKKEANEEISGKERDKQRE